MPGGEMHLSERFCRAADGDLVTYDDARKYALFDFWEPAMPRHFLPCIEKMAKVGIQPIFGAPGAD